MIRAIAIIVGLLLVTPLAAREPLPRILDCVVTADANWMAKSLSVNVYPKDSSYLISLDTQSGKWYLRNHHAAALTMDSGTFEILHDGTDYPYHWLGLDDRGATQLRISLYQPHTPFVFIDNDNALFAGRCHEPDEPFLFLSR